MNQEIDKSGRPYWAEPAKTALARTGSGRNGLEDAEAVRRLEADGALPGIVLLVILEIEKKIVNRYKLATDHAKIAEQN